MSQRGDQQNQQSETLRSEIKTREKENWEAKI